MSMNITVRRAVAADAKGMAKVHVESWRETYRGVMPSDLLDAPDLFERREEFWTSLLTEERLRSYTCAVAELDGQIVGVAMSGPCRDEDRVNDTHLYVLYTYQSIHGKGAGANLLAAVTDSAVSASLWVADPNPRAQRFYCNSGFVPDGASKKDEYEGVHEIRMVRDPQSN